MDHMDDFRNRAHELVLLPPAEREDAFARLVDNVMYRDFAAVRSSSELVALSRRCRDLWRVGEEIGVVGSPMTN